MGDAPSRVLMGPVLSRRSWATAEEKGLNADRSHGLAGENSVTAFFLLLEA